ncbi:MAG: hypothetical protein HY298_11995 [Verrucomicrobia bacterium]|nr:hypothetical protein [Verrucomicrobiota bacterium]
MKNTPLDWIKDASEPARTFRKMVIGWQNSVIALNATVRAFNSEFLKVEEEKDRDTHQLMREIAVKKLVISSLFELKPQLDAWYRRLEADGLLSDATKDKKKEVRHLLGQVQKFEGIRNAAFHFGDVNEETEELLRIYDEIHAIDLALLNRILEEMIRLGYMLREHASTKS